MAEAALRSDTAGRSPGALRGRGCVGWLDCAHLGQVDIDHGSVSGGAWWTYTRVDAL